jgi:hypothetical protein
MVTYTKSDDPTVPVMFRMRRSKWQWWVEQAEKRGVKPQKLIQEAAENRAELTQLGEQSSVAAAKIVRKYLAGEPSLARPDATPIPKKGK